MRLLRYFALTSLSAISLSAASCPSPAAWQKSVLGGRIARESMEQTFAKVDARIAERFVGELAIEGAPPPELDEGTPAIEAPLRDADVEPMLPMETLTDVPNELSDAKGANAPEDDDPSSETDAARDREHQADDTPKLASIARETWIFSQPQRKKSRRIGYLRAGAVVIRDKAPASYKGCKGGWYAIQPKGYVCLGKTATLDPFHPVVEASSVRPRRDGLPYDYVMSRNAGAPLYARLPTDNELAREEPDLGYVKRQLKTASNDPAFVAWPEPGAVPPGLLYGRALPALSDGTPRSPADLVVGHARVRAGYALLSQFEYDDRRYGLTTDLFVVPLDRTRYVKPSAFHGITLDDAVTLPVAFAMRQHATRFEANERGLMSTGTQLAFREAIPLTGEKKNGYLHAKDGSWVRAEDVRVIEAMSKAPTWAKAGKKWVDVSILNQSLVAYEGLKPVYVTLVSTGRDGLRDPKTTHSTVQGVFLIHTKHVSVTMDGDTAGDEFDLRDVPFVQYFTEGYALHAAYWHDDFGTPRSHGCVNLAPTDAAWVFNWTTPNVPAAWHGALALRGGTVVYTHP
ncbi:MAG: L,D-transpeptidase [Polyangiaceae bacterium]